MQSLLELKGDVFKKTECWFNPNSLQPIITMSTSKAILIGLNRRAQLANSQNRLMYVVVVHSRTSHLTTLFLVAWWFQIGTLTSSQPPSPLQYHLNPIILYPHHFLIVRYPTHLVAHFIQTHIFPPPTFSPQQSHPAVGP